MKTGWKVFWIVCAAIGGIGFICAVTGVALGANLTTIRQALGREIQYIDEYNEYDNSDDQIQPEDSVGEGYNGVTELDVSLSDCEVIVEKVKSDEISVDSSRLNRKLNVSIQQNGNELTIESTGHHLGRSNGGQLYIFIPEDKTFNKVDLEIGAGTLEMDGIMAKEFDLSVGAGHANITGCSAEAVKIECGAGQVDLGLAGLIEDYNYDIELALGEVVVGGDSYTGAAIDKTIDNGSAKKINIECGVGQVNVGANI